MDFFDDSQDFEGLGGVDRKWALATEGSRELCIEQRIGAGFRCDWAQVSVDTQGPPMGLGFDAVARVRGRRSGREGRFLAVQAPLRVAGLGAQDVEARADLRPPSRSSTTVTGPRIRGAGTRRPRCRRRPDPGRGSPSPRSFRYRAKELDGLVDQVGAEVVEDAAAFGHGGGVPPVPEALRPPPLKARLEACGPPPARLPRQASAASGSRRPSGGSEIP